MKKVNPISRLRMLSVFWMSMMWYDDFLKWDPVQFKDLRSESDDFCNTRTEVSWIKIDYIEKMLPKILPL